MNLTPEVITRFESKINKSTTTDCWWWIGSIWKTGYGAFCIEHKNIQAHRVSYELYVGPIPERALICHTCDNAHCVNPKHLYIGTNTTNNRDRLERDPMSFSGRPQQNNCLRGHELSGANLGISSITGVRWCKECTKLRMRAARAKKAGAI